MTSGKKPSKLAQEFTAEDAKRWEEQYGTRPSSRPKITGNPENHGNDESSDTKASLADTTGREDSPSMSTPDHATSHPKPNDTAQSPNGTGNSTPTSQRPSTESPGLREKMEQLIQPLAQLSLDETALTPSHPENNATSSQRLLIENSELREDMEQPSVEQMISNYFNASSPAFKACNELRQAVRTDREADEYFSNQRSKSNPMDNDSGKQFYKSMLGVAGELHNGTQGLKISRKGSKDDPPRILDLGTAPGGFLARALMVGLEHNQKIHAQAFTLPMSVGGLKEYLPDRFRESVDFKYVDITTLAADLDMDQSGGKVLDDKPFDLVICDAKVLSPLQHKRSPDRDPEDLTSLEGNRLSMSQVVLGLKHVRSGGTMVVRMHRFDEWAALRAVADFTEICDDVRLFKPKTFDCEGSSFYLVAKGIKDKTLEPVARTLGFWKEICHAAINPSGVLYELVRSAKMDTESILEKYGDVLVEKGEPIWKIQADALREESWTK